MPLRENYRESTLEGFYIRRRETKSFFPPNLFIYVWIRNMAIKMDALPVFGPRVEGSASPEP